MPPTSDDVARKTTPRESDKPAPKAKPKAKRTNHTAPLSAPAPREELLQSLLGVVDEIAQRAEDCARIGARLGRCFDLIPKCEQLAVALGLKKPPFKLERIEWVRLDDRFQPPEFEPASVRSTGQVLMIPGLCLIAVPEPLLDQVGTPLWWSGTLLHAHGQPPRFNECVVLVDGLVTDRKPSGWDEPGGSITYGHGTRAPDLLDTEVRSTVRNWKLWIESELTASRARDEALLSALSEIEVLVLEFLHRHLPRCAKQVTICEGVSRGENSVRQACQSLESRGLARRPNGERGGLTVSESGKRLIELIR